MPRDIEALLKRAKPRETTVAVYLAGDLVADIERLERQLADAGGTQWQADSLASKNPAVVIADKIEAARKRLKASEEEFRFRALSDDQWSDLLAAHPPKDPEKNLFDPDTFPRALIAACCIDPVMSPEQVDRLFAVLNQAQRNEIFDGAYGVNTEGTAVPFSLNASAILGAPGDEK